MKITNRKAFHEYYIQESLEVGIELLGPEVKSIRSGRVELSQSYAKILQGGIFLINANIPIYQNASKAGYDPMRSRRLLLHKSQIQRLVGLVSSGVQLIPVSLYLKNNLIKLQLGLGKSKRQFDKRRAIKDRDHQRRIQQELTGKE